MSAQSAVQSLPEPVRRVALAAASGSESYGTTPAEEASVTQWLERASTFAELDKLKTLNDELTSKTFVVADKFTVADAALYASIHPTISALTAEQYYALPAVTRYFDHVQHLPTIRSASSAPAVVAFVLDNAPKQPRSAPEKKEKKAKAPAAGADSAAGAAKVVDTVVAPIQAAAKSAAAAATAAVEGVVDAAKGGKKEKAPKEKKAAPPPAAPKEEDGPPVPSMVDLRVGKIIHVEKHPDADSLYVEKIDIGEPEPRTVVSGLVKFIPIEQMMGAELIAVCNLKPAKMRGITSYAMVLCASDAGKTTIELCKPPPGSKPGDRVYFEGEAYENAKPLELLNPKKKIFETVQPGFRTLDTREAAWVDPATGSVHRIRTQNGVVLAPTLVGASLS
ncbi:nucleic acid-binding protein [Auriculariales sp. MPI-PUGE-AT-0066]|nr:nucleic acid-binding protein [Auriculariales sp. MPI-PUGE-AT-0066]